MSTAPPPPFKNAWLQKTIENLAVSFKSEETRQWLQVFIVDPVLSYVMDRLFPYLIVTIIVIVSMILLTVSTFLLVFYRSAPATIAKVCPHCITV
jgi:hypothetical protein